MKTRIAILLLSVAIVPFVHGARQWDGAFTAFRGQYMIYSGELGETAAPTPIDRKAAIWLEGEIAKNLFATIGPDIKDACGTPTGLRVREKGDLSCTYDMDDRTSPYTCHFGIDLQNGKSIRGAIC